MEKSLTQRERRPLRCAMNNGLSASNRAALTAIHDGIPLTLIPAVPDFDRIEVLTRQQKPSEALFNERRGDED